VVVFLVLSLVATSQADYKQLVAGILDICCTKIFAATALWEKISPVEAETRQNPENER
jgi:hypothetical protein